MILLFQIALVLIAVFLILLVLIQRGRGGGLAGAFGGMGGQSAFGTKAGDVFTRITIGTAILWILLCILATKVLNRDSGPIATDLGGAQQSSSASPGTSQELVPDSEVGKDSDKDAFLPADPAPSGEDKGSLTVPPSDANKAETAPDEE